MTDEDAEGADDNAKQKKKKKKMLKALAKSQDLTVEVGSGGLDSSGGAGILGGAFDSKLNELQKKADKQLTDARVCLYVCMYVCSIYVEFCVELHNHSCDCKVSNKVFSLCTLE